MVYPIVIQTTIFSGPLGRLTALSIATSPRAASRIDSTGQSLLNAVRAWVGGSAFIERSRTCTCFMPNDWHFEESFQI